MILPHRLLPGDTIGMFSSSHPASAGWVDGTSPCVSFLQKQGFHVKHGTLTGKRDCYRSGSIQERAAELNALIADSEVKCIIAISGGYVSNSILPYIDYVQLEKNPKVIIGFSDITAILLAVYAQTGLITYYGPNMTCFDRKPPMNGQTYDYMSNILCQTPKLPYTLPTPTQWTDEYIDAAEAYDYTLYDNHLITLNGGVAEGRLLACNLDTLPGMMASPYMPQIADGDILLIENKNLDAETLEREFSMLKISGVFDKIGGLLIGKHIDFDDRGTGRKHYEILQEVMGTVDFPVLSEFDCSHAMPMLTIPIGCRARLDATQQQLVLMEPWICTD